MSTFRAGGLASGLDTNAIVETLVKIERRPIELLQSRQQAIRARVSALGDLTSRVSGLETAAKELADDGLVGMTATGSFEAFDATAGPTAAPGRYSIVVDTLATAAKARSAAFASQTDAVDTGTLTLTIEGTDHVVTKEAGDTLSDLARKINELDAPVSASVITDGTSWYLSMSRTGTGHRIGQAASDALAVSETSDGTGAPALSVSVVQQATNAAFSVDGLAMERTDNTVSDAIPGLELNLKEATQVAEEVVVGADLEATRERLDTFVEAYNEIAELLQKHLSIDENTDRDRKLAGDGSVRSLQRRLQDLISKEVATTGTVRTLVDLGLETMQDGSLKVDETRLEKTLAADPQAMNRLFSATGTGLAELVEGVADDFADPIDGLFSTRQKSLNETIDRLDNDVERYELRVENFQRNLIQQFTAMEQLVSGMSSMGNFLAAQMGAQGG